MKCLVPYVNLQELFDTVAQNQTYCLMHEFFGFYAQF